MEQEDAHPGTLYEGLVEDRRRYPRIELERPGHVRLASGETVDVTVHDLSPDGLQIRCTRAVALALHPSGRTIPAGIRGPDVHLVFDMPLPSGPVPLKMVGSIVHFALLGPQVVAIGLEFRHMSPASVQHVKQFIYASLEPRDPAAA